jgi:sigma-B regulation protein RsbU (phosphoserine phosphatase)
MTSFYRSFSTRLSLYIVLVTGVIFAGAFAVFFVSARQAIERESVARAGSELLAVTENIETVLAQVEATVRMAVDFSWETHLTSNPDSLAAVLKCILHANPLIDGASFAFEPYRFPGKGMHYMRYIYRSGGDYREKLLGDENYDYFEMDWYATPRRLQQACWSEPYEDRNGGDFPMVTFARPLVDERGRMFGVVTADISLESFSHLVNNMQPYPHSYTFMLSRKGYFITHRQQEEMILNKTVFEAAQETGDTACVPAGRRMLAGEKGYTETVNSRVPSYVFYAPVPAAGWSVALVAGKPDILAGLHAMTRKVALTALAGMLALFAFSVPVIRKVALPLRLFSRSAHMVASGNFDAPLPPVTSRDELGELRNAFDFMQQSLRKYIRELARTTAQKQRIESELQIARTIQTGMLPKAFPASCGTDIFALLHPAHEVGGDLYDFFMRDDKLYFAIGDVSGKGVPAALLMAVTCSLFRSAAIHHSDPVNILKTINHSLSETNETMMFITLFTGIIDLTAGLFAYCNAGHQPPFVISARGEVSRMSPETNLAAALAGDYDYRGGSLQLEEGSVLFLYTDGLTEARNDMHGLYGEKRLAEMLQLHAGKHPEALAKTLSNAVADYTGTDGQSDDLTLLVIRYRKARPAVAESITFDNQTANLAQATEFLVKAAERWSLSGAVTHRLRLAMEEAVSNVILYAYPPDVTGEVTLSLGKDGHAVVMEITDSGIPFDPTQAEEIDITAPAEARLPGGLGIHLFREIMDEVSYRRENGRNILNMKMNLKTS